MERKQFKILRGEDRPIIARVVYPSSYEPYSLEDVTLITAQFKQSDRTTLEVTSESVDSVSASVSFEDINYTALVPGINGNLIELTFDGVLSIQDVLDAWNTANVENTVTSDALDTSVVPTATDLILVDGVDGESSDIEILNAYTGKVSIRLSSENTLLLKTGPNQGFNLVIDKGDHPDGTRRIVVFDSALTVIDSDI